MLYGYTQDVDIWMHEFSDIVHMENVKYYRDERS